MRGWLIIAGLAALLVILPVVALTQGGWIRTLGQIVLTFVFILGIIGTGLFGYICLKAQARKWGAGLVLIALLCIVTIYFVWVGHLPLLP